MTPALMEKAGLSTGPVPSLSIPLGAAPERPRNLFGLPLGLGITSSRARQPLCLTDPASLAKVYPDHVVQLSVLKSSEPARPVWLSAR